MEEFRKKLQKKYRFTALFCCCTIAIFIVLKCVVSHVDDFAAGMLNGAFAGMCVVMIFNLARYRSVLKNEEQLEKMYIAATDERNLAISKETMKTASTISLLLTALAVLVSGFINPVISITLAVAMIAEVILTLVVQCYYQKHM